MAGKRCSSVQKFPSPISNQLLLGSLIEHLCLIYESDPKRSRMLFKVIGQHLVALNLLSPVTMSDEFSSRRLQHNRAFTELLHAASSSLVQVTGAITHVDTDKDGPTITPVLDQFGDTSVPISAGLNCKRGIYCYVLPNILINNKTSASSYCNNYLSTFRKLYCHFLVLNAEK